LGAGLGDKTLIDFQLIDFIWVDVLHILNVILISALNRRVLNQVYFALTLGFISIWNRMINQKIVLINLMH